ncbi:MAG TPA: ATP-dependent DNA helicase RecG [Candidatus Corynebacterium gallistercoris]|uniref:ATP-dependent DNA helicase RecG n=1 Tax=Candidatus Corynebacterium gallistercoris TaxID=2838530 RepID=A0A9D1RZQ2_9CORY|nr:ATP-dependent DNA helicase RecG [Candidatus Corynebacterium gallistercoris]
MLGWSDPRTLSGIITPDRARRLADKPGIKTVTDAVFNYPRTYVRMGSTQALDEFSIGEKYTCVAKILTLARKDNFSARGPRQFITFTFDDGTVTMDSALFGNPRMHEAYLQPGTIVLLHGKLDVFRDRWQLKNPSYVTMFPVEGGKFGAYGPLKTIVDVAGSELKAEELLTRPWMPSYRRMPGTSTAELLGVMDFVLAALPHVPEVLPHPQEHPGAPPWPVDEEGEDLISFDAALRSIHQPPSDGPFTAESRIKFNEALQLQLVMALRRADAAKRTAVPLVAGRGTEELRESLPFTLSPGQAAAWEKISAALDSADPASLMLQGEVGSGKTVVALLAMLQAVDSGMQCAFVAPTEVLAVQHARTLTRLLETTSVGVTVLTGSQKTAARKQALLDIVSGQANIVVGTHAVIQDSVEFYDLGLVVVDEQHRFGVRQRDRLREVAPVDRTPHMMVMTATPIPRTVAMTMFGDLTPVRLEGLPQGRGEVSTTVVPEYKPRWMDRIWQRMREEIDAGRQAFIVVPKIEGDRGVRWWYERLLADPLSGYHVAMLHGKMAAEDKDQVMQDFAAGKVNVLVATTVIEVGVDVPNATMMVIVDAENFGVSQLHQLRGRVGRGQANAVCLLHTSVDEDHPSYRRLEAVAATHDGFELAELDLRQRAEGDVLGQDQSGAGARRAQLLDLADDQNIIIQARDYAEQLVAYDDALARALVVDIEVEDQEYIERS